MLANIDLRCRDIFSNTESYGNVSVALVGDMRQLPPVFQQSGDDESLFRDALVRLSDGQSTPQDWALFNTRDYSMFSAEEKNYFKYVLCLFPTKHDANNYNMERLKDIGNPIARIVSKNNCDTARRARSDEAKGLQDILLLSKGARVMLRTNLATPYGLVNGARGIVVDIIYANGEKSSSHMPVAVMVEFDKYTGPKLYGGTTIIPITPQTTNWKSNSGVNCQRTQIPLVGR